MTYAQRYSWRSHEYSFVFILNLGKVNSIFFHLFFCPELVTPIEILFKILITLGN